MDKQMIRIHGWDCIGFRRPDMSCYHKYSPVFVSGIRYNQDIEPDWIIHYWDC